MLTILGDHSWLLDLLSYIPYARVSGKESGEKCLRDDMAWVAEYGLPLDVVYLSSSILRIDGWFLL